MSKLLVGVLSLALVALVGCNEGHDELKNADLAASADLSAPPDLFAGDLASLNCGQIVICILQTCGVTNLQCDQTCVQNAQPAAITQAGGLAACVAINCLNMMPDGGTAGPGIGGLPSGLILCMETACGMQVNACDGLPFAGM